MTKLKSILLTMSYIIFKKPVVIIFIVSFSFSCSNKKPRLLEQESAKDIIAKYYKNKYLDKSIVLEEYHRIKLDSVVVRLSETNEPKEVIQYIVNNYKLKYGMNND